MDSGRMALLLIILLLIPVIQVIKNYTYAGVYIGENPINSHSAEAINTSNITQSVLGSASHLGADQINKNPHWDISRCSYCHVESSSNGSAKLHAKTDHELCVTCHAGDTVHAYIHPIDLRLAEDRLDIIRELWDGELRLSEDGAITCQTCHDLLDQCLPERLHQQKRNPKFLRGAPYSNRYKICYRCHDASKYERVNAHDQIADNGDLQTEKCRLCHEIDESIDLKAGVEKELEHFPLINGMDEDRTLLCVRCHKKIDHPSSAFTISSLKKYRHLVRLEKEKKVTFDNKIKETGVVLPLEPNTGKIYCGTCHQPHQPGVFKGEKVSAPKMENVRLRTTPICGHCHDIYGAIIDTEARH